MLGSTLGPRTVNWRLLVKTPEFEQPPARRMPPRDDVMQSVAVIVAAYNAESTIVASLESILFGTTPCHVYVTDDCSKIPVANFLTHLKDRIEIIRLDKNVGPAHARNVAIDRAI